MNKNETIIHVVDDVLCIMSELTVTVVQEDDWYIAHVAKNEDRLFTTQGKTKLHALIMATDGLRHFVRDEEDVSDERLISLAKDVFTTNEEIESLTTSDN